MRTRLAAVLLALSSAAAAQQQKAPKAQAREAARHTVAQGETLWDIAGAYYKDHYKWRKIAEKNPAPVLNDPDLIYPGQVLLIPDAEDDQQDMDLESEGPSDQTAQTDLDKIPEAQFDQAPKERPQRPAEEAGPDADRVVPDSLFTRLPPAMTGQQPSVFRLAMSKDWSPEGSVLPREGRGIAAPGDTVRVAIRGEASKGQRYAVYRRSDRSEEDRDKTAVYVQRLGLVEIARRLSKQEYDAVVLRSGDAIQEGDMLKRER